MPPDTPKKDGILEQTFKYFEKLTKAQLKLQKWWRNLSLLKTANIYMLSWKVHLYHTHFVSFHISNKWEKHSPLYL